MVLAHHLETDVTKFKSITTGRYRH